VAPLLGQAVEVLRQADAVLRQDLVLKDSRDWVCTRASGDTLEVAVGTGFNLPLYPQAVRLTGIDLTPPCPTSPGTAQPALAVLRSCARATTTRSPSPTHRSIPSPAPSRCAIPDERLAITEMKRLLKPGGALLLADHVACSTWPVRAIQRFLEVLTASLGGEHS
jgi:hypothetical protein